MNFVGEGFRTSFYLITEITIEKKEGGRIVGTAVTEELLLMWGDLDFGITALILKVINVRSDCSEEKLIRHGHMVLLKKKNQVALYSCCLAKSMQDLMGKWTYLISGSCFLM